MADTLGRTWNWRHRGLSREDSVHDWEWAHDTPHSSAAKRESDAADHGEPLMAFTARPRGLQGVHQHITGAFARYVPIMASVHPRAGT